MSTFSGDRKSNSLLDSVLTVGVMAVIMFTALAHGAVEPWSEATFGFLTILLLAVWAIKVAADRQLTIQIPSVVWPLIALFFLGLLQSVALPDGAGGRVALSLDVEATRLTVEVIGFLLIISIIAVNTLATPEKLIWFRNFIIGFGMLLAVFGLVQHFSWNGKYYWLIEPSSTPSAPFGPFVNHNHFAGYMEMIAPIPVALILVRAARGELAMLFGFSAVLMAIATAISLSRGGMISIFCGLMLVIALGLRPRMGRHQTSERTAGRLKLPMALSRYAAAALIILTIGFGILWMGADPVIRRIERGELSLEEKSEVHGRETFFRSRGWIWRDTWLMIQDNWATGIGLGAFDTVYPMYSKRDGSIVVSHAHNDYLQALADGGIIGALLVVWFLVVLVRDTMRALRHRDPMTAGMALGCAGGLFALAVHSLFDFNLQLPSNALLFLVLTSVVSRVGATVAESRVNQTFLERGARLRAAA
ncbi:MAG: O-antigen ligase family protein [Blastocatellia bacterium]